MVRSRTAKSTKVNHPLVFHIRELPEDEGQYIGRGSLFGNPFSIGVHGLRSEVLKKHALWLDGLIKGPNGERPPSKSDIRKYLRGKKLKCFCNPKRCHGTTLALIANADIRRGLFR